MIDALVFGRIASALLALLVTCLMATGFVRLACLSRGLVRHMAMGILTIHLAVFLRTLYREIAPLVLPGDAVIFAPAAVVAVALTLNALIVLAGWHGLRALYLTIPERHRHRYSLLTAALYPPFRRR